MKIGIKSILLCASALALTPAADAQTASGSTTVRTTTTTHVSSRSGTRHRAHRARRVVHHRSRGATTRHVASSRTTTTTTTTRTDRTQSAVAPEAQYREGPQYQERVLTAQDRVYAGQDGRYYCRRPDGTTGLIVGGAAGALLGNVIAKGSSSTLGTILGAGAGALAGREIEQRTVRCR